MMNFFFILTFHFQYLVPESSKNSVWKQFWDRFRTDDEGIFNKHIVITGIMCVILHVVSLLICRNAVQLKMGYLFRNKDLGFWREIKCTFTNNLHVSQYLQLSALTETLEINTEMFFVKSKIS